MAFQITKREGRTPQAQPEFVLVGADKVIASATGLGEDGRRAERYQVLTIRDGKIADLQGCRTRSEAEHIARR